MRLFADMTNSSNDTHITVVMCEVNRKQAPVQQRIPNAEEAIRTAERRIALFPWWSDIGTHGPHRGSSWHWQGIGARVGKGQSSPH